MKLKGLTKFEEIMPNVFHLNFENQYYLTSTFLRFQEHFESPEFAGRIFSIEEYMDWYAKQKSNFTYYSDWNGFNIPSHILKPFFENRFNPLFEKEKAFLELFKDKGGKFYIIGTHSKNSLKVLKHEIAHALFYTNENYKKEILQIMDYKKFDIILEYLKNSQGYSEDVFEDEVHAYLLCTLENLEKKGVKIPSYYYEASKKMNEIFARYSLLNL